MKRLLLVLILVVAGVLGLGFYQKWIHIASDSTDGESNLTFTVDRNKIEEDRKKAQQKAQDLAGAPTGERKD